MVYFIKEIMTDICHTYTIIRKGLMALTDIVNQYLTDDAVTKNLADPNFIKPLRTGLTKPDLEHVKKAFGAIRGGNVDTLEEIPINHLIHYCSLTICSSVRVDIELSLLHFLMSFTKMGNVNSVSATKRIKSFKDDNLLGKITLSEDLCVENYSNIYKIVKFHFEKGTTSPEVVTENILKLLSTVKNVALKPLINYIAYTA